MNDQNTQDPQDELNALVQKVNAISAERKKTNTKLMGDLDSLGKDVEEITKKTDEAESELNQAEKEAGDEFDTLILEEAENQALEEEEDTNEED